MADKGDPGTMEVMEGGNVAEPAVRTLLARARARGVADLDAQLLLADVLQCPRAQLLAFDERRVAPAAAAHFLDALERRAGGEPLAYLTGQREFWSMPLAVGPGVLVPRPETELLAERCLALFDAAPRRIADLGTGSLAIAAALASERPAWRIVATDRSPQALAVARLNQARLRLPNIELRLGNWCEPLGQEQFDAILSNPPYIDPADPALAALRHEPLQALAAADEGYADLIAIAGCARSHLVEGGMLLLEHGATQGPRLAAALVRLGYGRIICHRDLAGHDRITEAQR